MLERMLDKLSDAVHVDPAEIRHRNLCRRSKTATR